MRFIEAKTLERLTAGSLEAFAAQISELASKQAGEDVEIFATHEDHAFGTAGDRVVKVTFPDSQVESVRIEDADIPIITEENFDEHVAAEVRGLAGVMMSEDGGDLGNRLLSLSRNLQPDMTYWSSDGFSVAESVIGEIPDWLEDGGGYDVIRAAVDHADKIERSVPSTPYARIPKGRLESFRPELMDSIRVIGDRLESLVEVMGGFTSDARAVDAVVNATRLRGAIDTVLKFSAPGELSKVAQFHDDLAEWTRPMIVLGAFLSEENSEKQNDAD